MEDCIFCQIIKGEQPSSKIYEDDSIIAIMDIQPINKGHVLIIPKRHGELMTDLSDEILGKLIAISNRINRAIRSSDITSEGINLFLADGEAAGQEVFHAHLHIIPRFKGDGFGFVFPEKYKDLPPRNELDRIADAIRLKFN